MDKLIFCLFLVVATGLLFSVDSGLKEHGRETDMDAPTTVEKVDISRYTGLWYEIAKIPNRFQRKCIANTTAQYKMRDDGKIQVINSCLTAKGKTTRSKGLAKVVDTQSNSRLKVSFFRPFWGKYWIIGLDADYQWAVVGGPKRKYGWILARKTELTDAQKETILSVLEKQGYQISRFEWTKHK